MKQSDAWRDMSINDRRMFDRLEIENMSRGGYENGKLVVTYDQFVEAGIRREAISATIAHLEILGWIEVVRGGYRGFARSWPNRFRLTHRPTRIIPTEGNPYFIEAAHEWRSYLSKKSNRMVPEPAPPQYHNRHCENAALATDLTDSAPSEPPLSVPEPEPLYISRVEGGGAGRSEGVVGGCDETG